MTNLGAIATGTAPTPSDILLAPDDNSARSPNQAMGGGSDLTLTGTLQRPNNCYYVTPRAGSWMVIGTFDVESTLIDTSNANISVPVCHVGKSGAALTNSQPGITAFYRGSGSDFPAYNRHSMVAIGLTGAIAAGTTLELLAYAFLSGTGTATVARSGTKIQVVQIGA